jgi:hypothetical protein
MALLDAHLKTATENQKMSHAQAQHQMDVTETALGMVATAHGRDARIQQSKSEQDKTDV